MHFISTEKTTNIFPTRVSRKTKTAYMHNDFVIMLFVIMLFTNITRALCGKHVYRARARERRVVYSTRLYNVYTQYLYIKLSLCGNVTFGFIG